MFNRPNLEKLDFVVLSTRTENPVASFLLPGHARQFIQQLRTSEGPHGPLYEVINADGPQQRRSIEG